MISARTIEMELAETAQYWICPILFREKYNNFLFKPRQYVPLTAT
jgi:hypothetical protein